MAEVIIYIMFYIIGVSIGSFFTLATYRIPLKQDITHTRSYCPNCNHRLEFLDLIPVLSYVFLKGKCRYCKKKISPRYIIMEISSGFFYILYILSLKINFFTMKPSQTIEILYGTIIISTFFIIGAIAKETKKISKETIIFGFVVQFLYIIYLCILRINIYRYIIFAAITIFTSLILTAALYIFNKVILKHKKENLIFYFCFLNIILIILYNFIFR